MGKKFSIAFVAVLIFASVLPTHAMASGGFVARKGETVYHSVFCELTDGWKLSNLRWFDTSEQAEAAGLSPCPECKDFSIYYYKDGFEPLWETDDHLLRNALEMEYEAGFEYGRELGYEDGYSEAEVFNYIAGHDDGYETGYAQGKKDGIAEMEQEIKFKKEEIRQSRYRAIAIIALAMGIPTIFYAINDLKQRKK